MPKLENPKHEAFALNLAKGQKQGEAYVRAGYQGNPSAASRMASQPAIVDRVTELEKEIMGRMSEVMELNSEEAARSLAEMGIDMAWVATANKQIYDNALKDASYAAANTAVSNIQKLIEMEKTGNNGEERDDTPLVKLSDVSNMLKEARQLIELGQKEGKSDDPAEDALDVTPNVNTTPAQILAARNMSDDTNHQS